MKTPTDRYTLLFDASCVACSRIADEIEQASDGALSAKPLRSVWAEQVVGAERLARLSGPGLVYVSPRSGVTVYEGPVLLAKLVRLLGIGRALRVYGIARRELGTEPVRRVLSRRSVIGGLVAGAAALTVTTSGNAFAASGDKAEGDELLGEPVPLKGAAAEAAKTQLQRGTGCTVLEKDMRARVSGGVATEGVYEIPVFVNRERVATITMYALEVQSDRRFGRVVAHSVKRANSAEAFSSDSTIGEFLDNGRNSFRAAGYNVVNGTVVPTGIELRGDGSGQVEIIKNGKKVPLAPDEAGGHLLISKCTICVRVSNVLHSVGCSVGAAFVIAAVCGPAAIGCGIIAGAVMAAACTGLVDFTSPTWCKSKGYCKK